MAKGGPGVPEGYSWSFNGSGGITENKGDYTWKAAKTAGVFLPTGWVETTKPTLLDVGGPTANSFLKDQKWTKK